MLVMTISYFSYVCIITILYVPVVLGKVHDSKSLGKSIDSPENKPTGMHLLDHYLRQSTSFCMETGLIMSQHKYL